jgi:hypothetical protein
MARNGLNTTARTLRAYAEETEQWKQDHDEAMECRDLEETLRLGNCLYRTVQEIAESRRQTALDPNDFQEIEEYYKWWIKPCAFLLGRIDKFDRSFDGGVEGAVEFRENCKQAKAFLEHEARLATVESRVGFRNVKLSPEAAEVVERILDDPAYPSPRPTYEPKSVPLADPSILSRGR